MNAPTLNLAVLVSGNGSTLQNLIDQIGSGALNAKIAIVVGSKPGLRAIERAREAKLPHQVVDRGAFPDCTSFSERVFSLVDEAGADLVCMAGWVCFTEISWRYESRVMNVHPSLLPSFGGKGMYGARVHRAVLDHGCKVSGCTVHFVDREYDAGPIILQRACVVNEDDTPKTLAGRVSAEEEIAYPEAIRMFADGKLAIAGRHVRVAAR